MTHQPCPTCRKGTLRPATVSDSQRVGRHTVTGLVVRVSKCHACSEIIVSSEELERIELQSVVVAFADAQDDQIGAEEVRFARKALGMSQDELAALLRYSKGEVSRWENGHASVPHTVRKSIENEARARLQPEPLGILEAVPRSA